MDPAPKKKEASAAPSLANAAINLISLREFQRRELTKILKSVKGDKVLVLDKHISGPLGLVAEVDLLKRHGVEKIHHLLPGPLRTESKNIMYLVRPSVPLMKVIANHIHVHRKETPQIKRTYNIFFVPRRTMLCERVLAEQGVLGDVNRGEYPLELIPFDDDVLSLEMREGFRECFLDGNPSVLFYVARSLMKLQSIFGIIPNIKGKGHMALRVYNLMTRMRREAPSATYGTIPEIDTLILIDRQVDVITPLLTQWTYEGLIDEVFGIKNSMIDVDAEIVQGKGPGTKKLALNSNDELFKEIRDLHFRTLGPLLSKKAEYVRDIYGRKDQVKSQTVAEMHEFMKEFKVAHSSHTFLQTHINLSTQIALMTKSKQFDLFMDVERNMLLQQETQVCEDYLEDCIAKMDKLSKVLRLLCLLSLTVGIKAKKFDFFRREIVQTYGFETMFTLNNLERLGMFNKSQKKSNWGTVKNKLGLVNPTLKEKEMDFSSPKDISFTYNGYSPLAVRLVELASQPTGWKKIDDILNLLPGKTFEATQDLPFISQRDMGTDTKKPAESKETKGETKEAKDAKAPVSTTGKKPITLVYFLGGVTFAEISALRHLSEKESHGRDYIIATTKLVSGSTLINSVKEKLQNNLVRKAMPPEEVKTKGEPTKK